MPPVCSVEMRNAPEFARDRVIHLDLDGPLPSELWMTGGTRLRLILWTGGIPRAEHRIDFEHTRCLTMDELAALAGPPPEATNGSNGTSRTADLIEPGDPRLPTASVLVMSHGNVPELVNLMDALQRQTAPFELVVMDATGGRTNARDVVATRFPQARFVSDRWRRPALARNAGIAEASGEIVAFLDENCRPSPVWMQSIRSAFVHPDVGAVTGPVLPLELATPAQVAHDAACGQDRGLRQRIFDPHALAPMDTVRAWRFGEGATMAMRRDWLQATAFDPVLGSGDDLDALYRVLRAGMRICFTPGAAVRQRGDSEWQVLRRHLYERGLGFLTYLDKVARTDTREFRQAARRLSRNWLRSRLRKKPGEGESGTSRLPVPGLPELLGGLAGYRGYTLARVRARRMH